MLESFCNPESYGKSLSQGIKISLVEYSPIGNDATKVQIAGLPIA